MAEGPPAAQARTEARLQPIAVEAAVGCTPRRQRQTAKFGQGLFSYVDQVRWLDDEASAQAWIARHPDAESLKAAPVQERLNAQIYLDSHTQPEVRERLVRAIKER